MRGGELEAALEKRWLWEKSNISKIKRLFFFKHTNPVKLQYIMRNPPPALLPINY